MVRRGRLSSGQSSRARFESCVDRDRAARGGPKTKKLSCMRLRGQRQPRAQEEAVSSRQSAF